MRGTSLRTSLVARIAGIGAVLAVCLALAACGSSSSSSSGSGSASTGGTTAGGGKAGTDKQVELAYFLPIANSFMAPATRGVQDAARDLNAKVTVYNADFDPSKQFNQMQDALSSGKKWGAWLVSPVDGATVAPGVQQATQQGIPVTCLISTCGPNGVAIQPQSGEKSFIGPNANLLGTKLGELAVDACRGRSPCNVFLLTIDPKFSVDRAMSESMRRVIAAHTEIKLESSTKGGAVDPEVARTTTQDYLQGHPNVDVVVSTADQMTRGIELAARDAGRAGQIKIISLGASRQGVEAVAAGRWYADVVRVPYNEGYKAAELAIRAARGEQVPPSVTTDQLTRVQVLTRANASRFRGQWDA
jgi:ribose transport system substrate-binding protein